MEFQEKLDLIWDRISDPEFLKNKGSGNEVRYFVFDYEPCDELIVRQKVEDLQRKNNPINDGFEIKVFDLYDMIIQFLEDRNYIDKCIRFEKEKGKEYLYEAITKMLRMTDDSNNLIVNNIMENTPEKAVVFLTGVGKAYPYVRAHKIINNLHQVFDRIPVILFYPGIWNGQTFSLYGTMEEDNYYRAFPLIQ